MWVSVLFLVQFNNFNRTMGFYWSYTLLSTLDWRWISISEAWYMRDGLRLWEASSGQHKWFMTICQGCRKHSLQKHSRMKLTLRLSQSGESSQPSGVFWNPTSLHPVSVLIISIFWNLTSWGITQWNCFWWPKALLQHQPLPKPKETKIFMPLPHPHGGNQEKKLGNS